MDVPDWQFAEQFKDIYQRASRLSRAFKKEFGKDQSPILAPNGQPFESEDDSCAGSRLIAWTGDNKFPTWVGHAPTEEPPFDVQNIRLAKPKEEFIAWLMLPRDPSGERWYFGRVFSRRRSLANHIRAFQDIASEAGKLLRSDSRFHKMFSPCVAHTDFVGQFPTLFDGLDASYWCAVLFTKPIITKHWGALEFPFRTDDIAVASIDDPFQMTADAIESWEFANAAPVPLAGYIASPHKWTSTPVAAKTPGDDQQPPNVNGSRLKTQLPPDAVAPPTKKRTRQRPPANRNHTDDRS